MKKVLAVLVVAAYLLMACTGCHTYYLEVPTPEPSQITAPNGEDIPVFDREYYADLSPTEYLLYLRQVFVSALYEIPRAADLGLSRYQEILCANGNYYGLTADVVKDNRLIRTETPVFYGLLAETEHYLIDHGENYDYLAAPYGKAHALRGVDVQAMINLLMRKSVQLSFSSVAGVEYIEEENLFIYDTLESPVQEFYARGWTLEYSGSDYLRDGGGTQWGDALDPYYYISCAQYCFWYDTESATLYDMYGGEVLGRTHAIDHLRGYYSLAVIKFCVPESRMMLHNWRGGYLDIRYADSAQNEVTLDTPITYVAVGSGIGNIVGEAFYTEEELLNQGSRQWMRDTAYFPAEKVIELDQTFFDDYYRDPEAGGKVSNYFLSSFYETPEEIDITLLPTQDREELARWCKTYLGIEVNSLKANPSTVGTVTCETPAIALSYNKAVGGGGDPYGSGEPYQYVTIPYYNEMLRQFAKMTLRILDTGYQFVSNLPDPDNGFI